MASSTSSQQGNEAVAPEDVAEGEMDGDGGVMFTSLPAYLRTEIASVASLLVASKPTESASMHQHGKESDELDQERRIPVLPLHAIASLRRPEAQFVHLLLRRHYLTTQLAEIGGLALELILDRAWTYEALGYPELAMGDGVVLLEGVDIVLAGDGNAQSDLVPLTRDGRRWVWLDTGKDEEGEADGEEDEKNEPASEAAEEEDDRSQDGADRTKEVRDAIELKYQCLLLLYRSAVALGCGAQAELWWEMAVETCKIVVWHGLHDQAVRERVSKDVSDVWYLNSKPDRSDTALTEGGKSLFGASQRLMYPWNEHEPDRMSAESLTEINMSLSEAAPLLEVRKSILPALKLPTGGVQTREDTTNGQTTETVSGVGREWAQLGLYAKEDLKPGSVILTERSVLSGIRPHGEALCDACAGDMEEVPQSERLSCPGCEIPFCSEACLKAAMQKYHRPNENDEETDEGYPPPQTPFCPGRTGTADIATLGRAESSTMEEWDLFFLLLSRTLQMAETQNVHPLDLFEIKYLWGDFNPTPRAVDLGQHPKPHTLPYSLRHHAELPLQWFEMLMLSRNDCAPYSAKWLERYDWWVVQTLYSKFRSVADAKQSTWTGKPETAAVHPLWCLANHSCNPTVTWRPGGVRNFTVLETLFWRGEENRGGIKKDEEIWNHYTDVHVDYKERRERLIGVLGGDCLCERCVAEEKDVPGGQG